MSRHILVFVLAASLALLFPCLASADPDGEREFDGKVVLFGNLHAHSALSDDVRVPRGEDWSPKRAFTYAHEHGIDFLALSDHQKAVDSPGNRLALKPAEYRNRLAGAAKDFREANPGFVAIPALEWGNAGTGNHINIIAPDLLPPDSIQDADYDDLIAWAREHAQFLQLNHPNSWKGKSNRNKEVGNYGEMLYDSTAAFVAAADPIVKTVSIITTVRGGHITGKDKHSEDNVHREMQWEKYYRGFLNMGFHISPSANQDTHWRNWGTVTAARTAVWADSATFEDVMKAFQANRVYASEDDELAVVFQVASGEQVAWMGDEVALGSEEEEVEVRVRAWQARRAGGDDQEEGPYTVTLIVDDDGVGGQLASELDTVENVAAGETVTIPFFASPGQYLYVQVTEENGSDNLDGEGVDEVVNGTDELGADGKRDDANDSAWTTPVWFVEASAGDIFVWSKSSNLYHDADCWVVGRIGQSNRREGPAPDGKTKHDCRPPR